MYIPKDARDPSEIQFKNQGYNNGVTYTAAEQAELFERFIQQDPYLNKHRGQVAERNGAKRPWYDRVDMKLMQDLFTKVGGSRRHTVQLTADIFNVLNLLNSHWGARKIYTVNNPLTYQGLTNGVPTFTITAYNNAPVTQTFISNLSTSSTWAMQLGLRYIF